MDSLLFFVHAHTITTAEIEIFYVPTFRWEYSPLRFSTEKKNMQISHTFALIYFEKSTHDTFNRIQIQSIVFFPSHSSFATVHNSTFWARLNDGVCGICTVSAIGTWMKAMEFTSILMRQTCVLLNEYYFDSFWYRRASCFCFFYLLLFNIHGTFAILARSSRLSVFLGIFFLFGRWSRFHHSSRLWVCANLSIRRKIWRRELCDTTKSHLSRNPSFEKAYTKGKKEGRKEGWDSCHYGKIFIAWWIGIPGPRTHTRLHMRNNVSFSAHFNSQTYRFSDCNESRIKWNACGS